MFYCRKRVEYGHLQDPTNKISDQDLLSCVWEVKEGNPHCKVQIMCGHLRSRGFEVTRECVRNALHSLDPLYI